MLTIESGPGRLAPRRRPQELFVLTTDSHRSTQIKNLWDDQRMTCQMVPPRRDGCNLATPLKICVHLCSSVVKKFYDACPRKPLKFARQNLRKPQQNPTSSSPVKPNFFAPPPRAKCNLPAPSRPSPLRKWGRLPRTISDLEPMNHSQIQRRAIAETLKPFLLLPGEKAGMRIPRKRSRIEPLNRKRNIQHSTFNAQYRRGSRCRLHSGLAVECRMLNVFWVHGKGELPLYRLCFLLGPGQGPLKPYDLSPSCSSCASCQISCLCPRSSPLRPPAP
jgi:hypothetical protein